MSQIHTSIQGKTVDSALTDGKELILRMTDGHEYVIRFDKGPYLHCINVRIILPMPGAASGVAFGS